MTTCIEKLTCRLCGSTALAPGLTLTPTPPANAFTQTVTDQECFPLEVRVCADCGHSQLGHVVSGLFDEYAYVSGTSASFRAHFERYAKAVSDRVGLKPGDLVVELGANDNTLLKCFPNARKIGVEPAKNLAKAYLTPGIVTLNDYFTEALAMRIHEGHGPAKLILANNVMAHIDDLGAVVDGVKNLLAHDGLFVFEVQYLGGLVETGAFDLCYHEHVSYHCITPLLPFFADHGLTVIDVEKVPTHGGSIRCFVAHAGSQGISQNVADLVGQEAERGLLTVRPWKALRQQIDSHRAELQRLFCGIQGRKVVGYGAPAKMATFCHEMGITADTLEYVCDDSPLKAGTFSPGLNIPILPPSALYEGETAFPDAVLILAWNFASNIIDAHKRLREENGTYFITPFPVLTVTS
jgi:hypothetical protein